ncbi:hypothetical protein FQ775_20145 [Nitratireductor mangrovi]|uniref:PH domain-containing protein n=1 Tax=Nitratireductor mangrovi TaxID=2599600 RepID=A0A5B8L3H6_9HYPH|nr:hypothetical protein [Nitratireductor mangrovi]QDZ02496.1 hypothetical protein FQ775_20145 [Nitratireductor mangrovi]
MGEGDETAQQRDLPGSGRILIRETADGIGVYNPSKRSWPMIAFMMFWLTGWSVGEFFVIWEVLSGAPFVVDAFLIIWLIFWTLGGIAVWMVLLWQLFGVEKLFLVSEGAIVTERGFGFFHRKHIFPVSEVTNPHLSTVKPNDARNVFASGRVAFESGGKTWTFGIGLDEHEASAVLRVLRDFLDSDGEGAVTESPDEEVPSAAAVRDAE